MGWCHEFGPQIADACEHPMTAHNDRCECTICGTVCAGRFAGCGAVWERGPREVAMNAPKADGDRWRVPLEAAANATRASFEFPVDEPEPEPEAEPVPALAAMLPEFRPEPLPPREAETQPPRETSSTIEPPDVTTRFAVAQLELLNDRVAGLTGDTLARTEAALEKVATELEQLRTQREIDYTEQATGIFGAVQTGADALRDFTKTVTEIADDLRSILGDSLKAIGGTNGLAAWVASSASELNETREEFAAALARIERDMTLLRRRANAEAKAAKNATAKIDDEQLTLIVDAVTDAVLAAMEQSGRKRR